MSRKLSISSSSLKISISFHIAIFDSELRKRALKYRHDQRTGLKARRENPRKTKQTQFFGKMADLWLWVNLFQCFVVRIEVFLARNMNARKRLTSFLLPLRHIRLWVSVSELKAQRFPVKIVHLGEWILFLLFLNFRVKKSAKSTIIRGGLI